MTSALTESGSFLLTRRGRFSLKSSVGLHCYDNDKGFQKRI